MLQITQTSVDSIWPAQKLATARQRSTAGCRSGFTLIELVIVVAIVAAFVVIAAMQFDGWRDVEAARSAARSVESAFSYARGEAIRTGRNHLVFIQNDTAGNALNDADGNVVPLLVLDDGLPGSPNQNCVIDAGEAIQPVQIERGVEFGVNAATATSALDEGTGDHTTGSSFVDSSGSDASWVMFRSDGTPRAVDAACTVDALGSGGGAIYLNNPERDVAVVLTPLGSARVQTWHAGSSAWQ